MAQCSIVIASGTMDDVPLRCFKNHDAAVNWADLMLTSQAAIFRHAEPVLRLLSIDVSEWVAVKVVEFDASGNVVRVSVCDRAMDRLQSEGGETNG